MTEAIVYEAMRNGAIAGGIVFFLVLAGAYAAYLMGKLK